MHEAYDRFNSIIIFFRECFDTKQFFDRQILLKNLKGRIQTVAFQTKPDHSNHVNTVEKSLNFINRLYILESEQPLT